MEEGLISGEEIFEAKVQNMSTETAAKKLEYVTLVNIIYIFTVNVLLDAVNLMEISFSGGLTAPFLHSVIYKVKQIFVKIEVFLFVQSLINPIQPSVSFHVEPSRLICYANFSIRF